jgi:uncharacterized membrane protein
MDKATYLAELAKALSGLTETDRQNTLAYYNEFLNDAETEGQTDASAILGNPHTLAAQIKADIAMESLGAAPAGVHAGIPLEAHAGAHTELHPSARPWSPTGAHPGEQTFASTGSAYPDVRTGAAPGTGFTPPPTQVGGFAPPADTGGAQGAPGMFGAPGAPGTPSPGAPGAPGIPMAAPPQAKPQKSGIGVIWTVILAILAIPIGIPLAIAVIVVIFAVLVALGAILVSLIAVVVAFLVASILSWIVGFCLLFTEFATGLFYLGVGLVASGLCILFGMAFWQLGKLCIRGVARLFNSIRKRLTKRERNTP